ncbi:MAG TPA: hypothetical protein VKH43_08025, partial [Thermoanaerobaculia bacterium]|nr:hypothetical protein [Thermoanaerobaculia bacterium]
SVGPGISVHYLHTGEDAVASMLKIEIWNRLKLYATVNPTDGPGAGLAPFENSQPDDERRRE